MNRYSYRDIYDYELLVVVVVADRSAAPAARRGTDHLGQSTVSNYVGLVFNVSADKCRQDYNIDIVVDVVFCRTQFFIAQRIIQIRGAMKNCVRQNTASTTISIL